jgi:hypothetical protein
MDTTMSTNIIEGNKLIAEFMGAHVLEPYVLFYDVEGSSEVPKGYPNDPFNREMNLEYHTSWDWLMPVVKKIFEGYALYEIYDRIEEGLIIINIEVTWQAVVEFIQWYNTNNSK